VAGYNVYRASSAGGAFAIPINSAPLTTTRFTDGSYGLPGVYYYKVSAVDTAGNESEKSAAIAADTVGITETVGSGGATLTSSTGQVAIDIPAGALSGPVPIKVVGKPRPANMGRFTFASRAFEFLPAGQTFGSDVSITVAYEPGDLDETTMRLVYNKAGRWTFADVETTVDQAGNKVIGRVDHFTDFAAASADITPPTISSVAPANAATGVSVADFVTVVFSEPMDPSTLNNSTMQIRTGEATGTPISVETVVFSADKKTVYLYPDRMLDINTTYRVWVSGAGVSDLAGNPLGADVSTTFATASNGVSPHDGYAVSTNLCRNCHAVRDAVGPTLFVEAGEKQVCYTCHDGTGSSYNVKTTDNTSSPYSWDFVEAAIGATSKISYHLVPKASTTVPVTGATMLCSNCHNVHSMTGTGARFLAPKGLDLNPANRGSYAAQTGNAFCFTCHNTSALLSAGYISTASWDKSTGFDHKTYYPPRTQATTSRPVPW
jgi:predicted CXXCH cytochrome family protein